MDPFLKFVHAELGYCSPPGSQSPQRVLVPPAPSLSRSRCFRSLDGPPPHHSPGRGFDSPGGSAIPPGPMSDAPSYPLLTQERWWYWGPWNPLQETSPVPGLPIRVDSGHLAFRQDFMAWCNGANFHNEVITPYHMTTVPDLTPAMVSGPGYGWGEFFLPFTGETVHLTMAAAHFQALAFAFYREGTTPDVEVTWELANDANGTDRILGQNSPNGMVPTNPVGLQENRRVSGGPAIVNARLWRAQPVPREVHLRMRVSSGVCAVPVFAMGLLGQLD